jgi:hypothetical protein
MKTDRKAALPAERLREVLDYNPETGEFVWRMSNGKRAVAGQPAGGISRNGYVRISIDTRHYAHRLAWFYVHGVWPKGQIDHINGIRDDNRIENLREATASQNGQNRRAARADSHSGKIGVRLSPTSGRWGAEIVKDGEKCSLGYFDTPDAAHDAYLAAKRELHEFGEVAKDIGGHLPNREIKGRQIAAKHGTKSGVLGVSFVQKTGKWKTRINIDGKAKYLGCFDTAELAGNAYREARKKLLGQ